jgi:hypothetical protein
MAEEKTPTPQQTAKNDEIDFAAGDYLTFAEEDAQDRKRTRIALVIAAVFHGILLMITFPEIVAQATEAAKQQKLYVVQQVRFQPPPPKQKQEIPKPKAKKVPIPDPTPDAR